MCREKEPPRRQEPPKHDKPVKKLHEGNRGEKPVTPKPEK